MSDFPILSVLVALPLVGAFDHELVMGQHALSLEQNDTVGRSI